MLTYPLDLRWFRERTFGKCWQPRSKIRDESGEPQSFVSQDNASITSSIHFSTAFLMQQSQKCDILIPNYNNAPKLHTYLRVCWGAAKEPVRVSSHAHSACLPPL